MDHRTVARRATARASTSASIESNRFQSETAAVRAGPSFNLVLDGTWRTAGGEKTAFHAAASDTCRQASGKQTSMLEPILMGVRLAMRSFHSCDERLPPPPLRRVHLDGADPSPSMRTHSSRARSTSSARRRIPLHACPRGLRRASASEGGRRAPPRSASAPASAGSRAAAAAPNPGRQ